MVFFQGECTREGGPESQLGCLKNLSKTDTKNGLDNRGQYTVCRIAYKGPIQATGEFIKMWKAYQKVIKQYSKIPLSEERRLIAEAQKGSEKDIEEIVLRHIGFVVFRIHRKVFPEYLSRFGEDLLSDSLPILYQKIKTYNLKYRDRHGHLKPVKFVSYIWKRIDGHIIDSLKKEIAKDKKAKFEEALYADDRDEESG